MRDACADALSALDLDAAVLLTSELVSNAVLHTDSPCFEVTIMIGQGVIRIGVRDDDLTSPAPNAPAEGETTGRGLQIVDRMSSTWGVDYDERRGKFVWFSMYARPPF